MSTETPELTEARKTLLDHYTTQLTSHYGYFWIVATVLVGFMGLVGVGGDSSYCAAIAIYVFHVHILSWVVGWFLVAAGWLLAKCFFYGTCTRRVISTSPCEQGPTLLKRMDQAAVGSNPLMILMEWPWLVFPAFLLGWPLVSVILQCWVFGPILG